MLGQASETRQCPFCKEEVQAAAVRCKYCRATISPERPDHEGVCPFCKEGINVEAIRCKHCQADLVPTSSPVRLNSPVRRLPRRRSVASPGFTRRGMRPRRIGQPEPPGILARADAGCADYDIDDAGTWCFLESSEHYCIYELCDPAPVSPYGVFE